MSTRIRQLALLLIFAIIIGGVPLFQGGYEVLVEEEDLPLALSVFQRIPTEETLRTFEQDLEESSLVEDRVRKAFMVGRYMLYGDLGEKALEGVEGWYFYHPGLRYLTERYFRRILGEKDSDPDDGHAENANPVQAIVHFADQLRARGIALVVVPIPGKASIYPDRLNPTVRPRPAIYAHTSRFISELRHKGVTVVELHPTFLAARDADLPLYMRSDTHWTGDGVLLAAKAIADALRHMDWFQPTARSKYERREVEVVRHGDIPTMTQIPGHEKLFTPQRVRCYQVLDKNSGQPYEDAEESPILLLGDSFSRVFQTDEPEAAGLIANLAYELRQPLTSIVNDGGASTLVRQQLAQMPFLLESARVVVWAFVERDIRFGLRGWQKIDLL